MWDRSGSGFLRAYRRGMDLPVDPAVLQKSFRSAMGNVAAAVSVVTTFHDGGPHGTRSRRLANIACEIGIGHRLAERNFQQAFPDTDLEIRADQHHPERLVARPLIRLEYA